MSNNDNNDSNDNMVVRKSLIRCWAHANPNAKVEERKGALIDFLVREFPEITRGGHRGLVNRMDIFDACEHECPYCHERFVGMEDIAKKAGIRYFREKFYFQSWCNECRIKGYKKSKSDPTYNKRVNSANEDCVIFTN